MTRLHVPSFPKGVNELPLTGDLAHYVRTVLRAREGEEFIVFDDSGARREASFARRSGGKEPVLILGKTLPSVAEPRISAVLVQGMLKGQKMDLVVQKATELGAREIAPVVTERSQVRETRKVERWRKIALEASRQCGRAAPPIIHAPLEFGEFLAAAGGPLSGYVFTETGGGSLDPSVFSGATHDILALIGPEGGLTQSEVQLAIDRGLRPVTLGPLVLRAETASLAALTLIQFSLGNMGR